jgi:integrase
MRGIGLRSRKRRRRMRRSIQSQCCLLPSRPRVTPSRCAAAIDWKIPERRNEIAEMTWYEVDLDNALWVIPPERMTGDAAHEVPLPPMAIDVLTSLPRWTGPFVFSTTGGERPIGGFSKMKLRVDAAMKEPIAPWRFHDLRRTMRTGLGALPVPNNVAELCIAHVQPGLHRVYDRHSYRDEKRRAFELWATRVAEIVEPRSPGNVVRLNAV